MREEYRKEFEQRVFPLDQYIISSERGAIDYGMMGIKSLYILNGGAVIVLPAYITLLDISINSSSVILMSFLFFCGLVVTFVANLFAYFNLCHKNILYQNYRDFETLSINLHFYKDSYTEEEQSKLAADLKIAESKEDKYINQANWTRNFAILFVFLGICAFSAGSYVGLKTMVDPKKEIISEETNEISFLTATDFLKHISKITLQCLSNFEQGEECRLALSGLD